MFGLNAECTLIDLWFKFQKTESLKIHKIKRVFWNLFFIPYVNNTQTSNYTKKICGTNNRPTHSNWAFLPVVWIELKFLRWWCLRKHMCNMFRSISIDQARSSVYQIFNFKQEKKTFWTICFSCLINDQN